MTVGRLLNTFGCLVAGAALYTVVFQFFYNWMRYSMPLPLPLLELLPTLALNYIPFLSLTIINYLLVFHVGICTRPRIKFSLDLILSFAGLALVVFLFKVITGLRVEYAGTVFSNLLLVIGMEYIFHERKSRMSLSRQNLMSQELLRYQFEALKAQIDPHFLFNSLNILYSFVDIDPVKSKEYVLHLSRVYRYILNQNDRTRVSLQEEMSFLESYIDILKIRYNNNFKVIVEGMGEACQKEVIPYTLQLLIENVTKHNIISSQFPMTVFIDVRDDCLKVINDIRMKELGTTTHIGTKYLTKLYNLNGVRFRTFIEDGKFVAVVPYLNAI